MSIALTCPYCAAKLKAKNTPCAGRAITCPKCGQAFVPTPPAAAAPSTAPVAELAPPAAVARPAAVAATSAAAPVAGSALGAKLLVGGLAAAVLAAGVVMTALLMGDGGQGDKIGDKGDKLVTAQGLDQRVWEGRVLELNAELSKARSTGNQLVLDDQVKKLEEFYRSTLVAGEKVSGWIGLVTSVGTDNYAFKDRDGKAVPALAGTMELRDSSADTNVAVRFTNYDPVRATAAGLDKEFRELTTGQLIRVWGTLHKRPPDAPFASVSYDGKPSPVTVTITATRFAAVDLKKERAEAIATIDKAAVTLAKLTSAHDSLLRTSFLGTSYNVHAVEFQSLMLAAHFPDYCAAVNDFNRFEPLPAGRLESWTKGVPAAKERLENERLLDEAKALAEARQLEAELKQALTPMEKHLQSVETIGNRQGDYGPLRLPGLRGEIKDGSQLTRLSHRLCFTSGRAFD